MEKVLNIKPNDRSINMVCIFPFDFGMALFIMDCPITDEQRSCDIARSRNSMRRCWQDRWGHATQSLHEAEKQTVPLTTASWSPICMCLQVASNYHLQQRHQVITCGWITVFRPAANRRLTTAMCNIYKQDSMQENQKCSHLRYTVCHHWYWQNYALQEDKIVTKMCAFLFLLIVEPLPARETEDRDHTSWCLNQS